VTPAYNRVPKHTTLNPIPWHNGETRKRRITMQWWRNSCHDK
jgi:hypothetical protein